MNPSLATFMKLAATAVCIAAFIFVWAMDTIKDEAEEQDQYMLDNTNIVIETETSTTP
jgi:hypothetical protein